MYFNLFLLISFIPAVCFDHILSLPSTPSHFFPMQLHFFRGKKKTTTTKDTKQTKKKDKNKQTGHKKHEVCFVLANCPWHGAHLEFLHMLSDTPLEKPIFPFSSRYQLQIVSWLVLGTCVHTQHWHPGTLSGLNLCGLFVLP